MAAVEFDRVCKVFDGELIVDALDLTVPDGELLVLVGPSGCGKSTVLRMLAGLEALDEGTIRIGKRIVNELPPQKRKVAMVFQNYALYPHMTVRQNLAYPLKMQNLPRAEIQRRVNETAAMLDLAGLLERRPLALSGGQRQRVAMGRAIIRDAELFLMDEPLSNLDAKLRGQIRTEIAALQARLGITTLYVTHDQTEAMTLGRRVAVMRGGRLQQVAPPHELYSSPANVFVAGFIGSPGMNVLRAALEQEGDKHYLRLGGQCVPLARAVIERHSGLTAHPGSELLVGIRPEHLAPADGAEPGSLRVTVSAAESLGHETILYTNGEARTIATDTPDTSAATEAQPPLVSILPGHRPIAPGEVLHLRPDPERLYLFELHGQVLAREVPGPAFRRHR